MLRLRLDNIKWRLEMLLVYLGMLLLTLLLNSCVLFHVWFEVDNFSDKSTRQVHWQSVGLGSIHGNWHITTWICTTPGSAIHNEQISQNLNSQCLGHAGGTKLGATCITPSNCLSGVIHKIHYSLVAINMPLELKHNSGLTRTENSVAYHIPASSVDYQKNSFFYRTVRDWNCLPDDTVHYWC